MTWSEKKEALLEALKKIDEPPVDAFNELMKEVNKAFKETIDSGVIELLTKKIEKLNAVVKKLPVTHE
jgi:flagellar capping protein FliD